MFVSRNFQLVYSQSHPWVGLETVGDLSLCFCNVSFLIRSCPYHLALTQPWKVLYHLADEETDMMSYVRFPDFSSHAYSIALSHIWHLIFIIPTWN